ncbi:MAG: glycosyltransferase [Anaerolineae bacterium]
MPQVSIVIPSLSGQLGTLETSIKSQSFRHYEICAVVRVKPSGRARNVGAKRAKGDILVFIDDDAVLGDEHTIANLVEPLQEDHTIGVTGASKLIPPDSSWFQRWVAREVPRIQHPIVDEPLETNPDPERGYYCKVTTTCCAMRREVFEEAGGFNEELVRGVDTEFFVRLRRLGYRFILVPNTWVWHPAPPTLGALLRKHFLYGVGHSQEVKRDPSRGRGRFLKTPLHAIGYLLLRNLIVLPNVFIPYSSTEPRWGLGFKPLKALTSYVSALGYVYGWYKRR